MNIYIQSTGNISPQNTFGHPPLLQEVVTYNNNRLQCIEPDYNSIIDVKLIRRMSRIIKMGVAAAMDCLQEAGIAIPDAIITGTAYGCLEDTGVFLKKMVEQKEEMLTPTSFIQSTHNTIGAQIALLLQCHSYNNAFVHRGFSFESALLDATMLLEENAAVNVLVGGIDEITAISHTILNRFGLYKQHAISNLDIYKTISKGTIAGEGAAFFLLSNQPSVNNYAVFNAMHTFYKPMDIEEIKTQIENFLTNQSLTINDIDIILTGQNGDYKTDEVYKQLNNTTFKEASTMPYKHLCGEYPTSTGFALWLAASIIKIGVTPSVLNIPKQQSVKRILIYNHYNHIHHSLLLVSAC